MVQQAAYYVGTSIGFDQNVPRGGGKFFLFLHLLLQMRSRM